MDSITLALEMPERELADEGVTSELLTSLYETLQAVPDHRHRRGRRYEQAMVLALLLVAKLAGEKTLSGIAQWVRHRSGCLSGVFTQVRFPCANTYGNICATVDAEELQQQLSHFFRARQQVPATHAEAVHAEAVHAEAVHAEPALRHLACDGKELRGTHRHDKAGGAMLGIYDVATGAMAAQVRILGKGQEQSALRAWLQGQGLSNCLITADALHTQTKTVQLICERRGHYLLIVKENQPQLLEDIASAFGLPCDASFQEQSARSSEKGHGRQEVRLMRSSPALNDYLTDRWQGVAQVFRLERTITKHARTTVSVAYGLTSLSREQATAAQLLQLVRQHWAIENRSHWRRDATLGEDACKVSSAAAAATLAVLNSALLALADILKTKNLRSLMRRFAAKPQEAINLLFATS